MQGHAPGWQVRCVRCQATRDAASVGIVRVGAWSWKKFTLGWCSLCHRLSVLAIERPPAGCSTKPVADDDDFNPPAWAKPPGVADHPATGRRVLATFAAVAAGLYLPFCWVILAGPGMARFAWSTRWILWLVIPGFVPGTYLFHPDDRLEWISWAVVTLGLLVGLTWLGAMGRQGFWLALGLALLVAIPSSLMGYVLVVLN